MKWFRSNIRQGSRLALFALAIQFALSFGHCHGGGAQAAVADAKLSAQQDAVSIAMPPSSDHDPDSRPADGCPICAVLALADATMITPPHLSGPHAVAFSYLIIDAASVDLNSASVA